MYSINNKTAITLICLGIIVILVCIPLYFEKIKMNSAYGFRIGKAFESEENWYRINKYGAKVLMFWALAIMVVVIMCLYADPQSVLTVAKITFVSVLVPLAETFRYARRL